MKALQSFLAKAAQPLCKISFLGPSLEQTFKLSTTKQFPLSKRETTLVVDSYVLIVFYLCGNHWFFQSTAMETALSVDSDCCVLSMCCER